MALKSLRGRLNGQPNPVDVFVGNSLRKYRTLKGFSQERLATELGLTFQQVQKYEKGLNRIGASRLWDISQILHVSIACFFEGLSDTAKELSPRNISAYSPKKLDLKVSQLENQLDDDPLNRKETLELVRAYYAISNRETAHSILELLKSLADINLEEKSTKKK